MQLDLTENGFIRLTEVYNPIVLKSKGGVKMVVTERDGGFEIYLKGADVRFKNCINGMAGFFVAG